MKSKRAIYSAFVALATALSLFALFAHGQSPAACVEWNGERVFSEAMRITNGNEPVVFSPGLVRTSKKAGQATTSALIGFLPADLFVSNPPAIALAMRYAATPGQFTISRPASRGNDNDEDATLAMKLRNPVSSLARISFENTVDFGMSANREGFRITNNIEPVLPISLNKDWNLISRTTLPFIQQDDVARVVRSSVQTGFADILQSVFVSPSRTDPFFWGAGAAVLIPTATDTQIGGGKLALGPTLVIGRQQGGWTYGALARHMWSVAGHRDRADVRSTLVRPFVAYTTKSAWTLSLDSDSTYDWLGKQWSAPIHLELAKVVRFVHQPVSVGAGLRCWAATFAGGPQACGVRFTISPLFPAR